MFVTEEKHSPNSKTDSFEIKTVTTCDIDNISTFLCASQSNNTCIIIEKNIVTRWLFLFLWTWFCLFFQNQLETIHEGRGWVSAVSTNHKISKTLPISIMTSSIGNIFRVTGPLWGNSSVTGEFPSQRPVTQSFDMFFVLRLNKRLNKLLRRRGFKTPSR